jgi:hypothetical protein
MCLRLGLIFTVTGIIALAHYGIVGGGHLSPGVDLIVGIVLVVLGLSLVGMAVLKARRR